ncbi:MAG: YggS family pyridoxal phosphate-dependent enzyme [Lachnospiraceae bacterium]
MIESSLAEVKLKIKTACQKVGRSPEEVTLVAVSKTKPIALLEEAYQLGVRDFGENKVQELVDKYEVMPKDIRWHMIGHLQRNKVKYIVDKTALIHSVDSLRLMETIEQEAAKKHCFVNVLIQVNVAEENSKFGIKAEELSEFLDGVVRFNHVKVKGLMTIAPYVKHQEENRKHFARLEKLSVDIMHKNIDNGNVSILSMGMSGDYMVAIEEGANMVRVGTGIFGERDYSVK